MSHLRRPSIASLDWGSTTTTHHTYFAVSFPSKLRGMNPALAADETQQRAPKLAQEMATRNAIKKRDPFLRVKDANHQFVHVEQIQMGVSIAMGVPP